MTWWNCEWCSRTPATGAPITDGWTPWLGAWAHLLALREDVTEPVHGHPEEALVVRSAAESSVHIDSIFPRAGHYRIWVQLQRGGEGGHSTVQRRGQGLDVAVAPAAGG